jgi:hypothetical protein
MKKLGKYITRLTHNNNNWTKPSCKDGKCISTGNKRLYEQIAGFGWEEWLFNPKNRIEENGEIYQYGFLQCFNKTPLNEEIIYEKVFLYTRQCFTENPKKGTYHLVAKIENLIQLSKKQLDVINIQFKENGNFDIMRNDDCVDKKHFDIGPIPNDYKINAKFKVADTMVDVAQTKIKPISYRFNIMELKPDNDSHNQLIEELNKTNTFNNLD